MTGAEPWYLYCFSLNSLHKVSVSSSATLYLWEYVLDMHIYTISSWTHNLSGRPHEDFDDGTGRGRATFSLTGTGFCDMEHQNNKVVYCCSHPKPKHCYDTFPQCQVNCYIHNRNWLPIQWCIIYAILRSTRWS